MPDYSDGFCSVCSLFETSHYVTVANNYVEKGSKLLIEDTDQQQD